MIFVYQELGVSALAGVAVLVAMVPLIAIIGKLGEILQRSQLKAKDSRIKVNNYTIHKNIFVTKTINSNVYFCIYFSANE